MADAVALASGQDRLSPFHRLLLASAWTRNGLSAPASLELSPTDIDGSGLAPGILDRTVADALLDDLFRTLTPKMIAPNKWLPEILGSAVASLTPDSIQRFADLILMRANACVERAENPAEFALAMSGRSSMAARDWAAGFSYACGHFRSSWPAKSTTHVDRAMMHRISDAMSTGFTASGVKTLGQWISARHEDNCRT